MIVSMLGTSVGLPLLLRGQPVDVEWVAGQQENLARIVAARAAIAELNRLQEQGGDAEQQRKQATVAASLIELYRRRIHARSRHTHPEVRKDHEVTTSLLHIAAIKAARDAIFTLLREQQIGSDVATRLVKELDLLETRHDL